MPPSIHFSNYTPDEHDTNALHIWGDYWLDYVEELQGHLRYSFPSSTYEPICLTPPSLESAEHFATVHPGFDDLQRDEALDRFALFRDEDFAHPAGRDRVEELVGANLAFILGRGVVRRGIPIDERFVRFFTEHS